MTVKITCDEGYTADFLREVAIELETREENENFEYETAHGYAEVEYD